MLRRLFHSSIPRLIQDPAFHRRSDAALNQLVEYFEDLGDKMDITGFDVQYNVVYSHPFLHQLNLQSGVLTLKLGEKGTYVINKQPPNRQIWLSSPIRYFSRLMYEYLMSLAVLRDTILFKASGCTQRIRGRLTPSSTRSYPAYCRQILQLIWIQKANKYYRYESYSIHVNTQFEIPNLALVQP